MNYDRIATLLVESVEGSATPIDPNVLVARVGQQDTSLERNEIWSVLFSLVYRDVLDFTENNQVVQPMDAPCIICGYPRKTCDCSRPSKSTRVERLEAGLRKIIDVVEGRAPGGKTRIWTIAVDTLAETSTSTSAVYTVRPEPATSFSIMLATEYLAKLVHMEQGTKMGQDELYWHLVQTINAHVQPQPQS